MDSKQIGKIRLLVCWSLALFPIIFFVLVISGLIHVNIDLVSTTISIPFGFVFSIRILSTYKNLLLKSIFALLSGIYGFIIVFILFLAIHKQL